MSGDVITIFDTTLRDGEQSPGCSMTTDEKMEVAKALVELGVDVIEAGFPIASPDDFNAVQKIAREYGGQTTICGLSRCRAEDIDRAGEALKDAEKRRMHVFLATSAIHREHKLKMGKDEIVQRAIEMVERAKGFTDDVEFSPEDAARTELDFLCEVTEKAIAAGATTVNIPDTVGYSTPSNFFNIIRHLKENVSNIEAGARQVECTINGLGERAGNAALEEIVMAIQTRKDHYKVGTNINTKKLFSTSRLISRITGMLVQRNKAIVGQNAFAHEAGIHQHGMLQNRSTYEIMRPDDVGYVGTNLVLGKHSGRHAFRDRVKHLGYELDDSLVQEVFDEFISLADKKKDVYDSDIIALIEGHIGETQDQWSLERFHTVAGTDVLPTATLEMRREGFDEVFQDAATGDGPVDAIFRALERVVGIEARLTDYQVRSISSGKDAQGEVMVEIKVNDRVFHGKGVSTDIVAASARAYLKALNRAAVEGPAAERESVEDTSGV
jgi:2-isopropylmalate synthase